jgi:fluoride exporter
LSAPTWIAVALVGGGAAAVRFSIDAAVASRSDHPFPFGILAINLAGTLALGLVAGAALDGEALIVVAGGGIGSFTTFSTWILDSHRLAEAGHTQLVWLNIGLSLLAGFAAIALGNWLGHSLF